MNILDVLSRARFWPLRFAWWFETSVRYRFPRLSATVDWCESLIYHRHNARVIGDFEHRMSIVLCECTRGMSKPYYDAEDMRVQINSFIDERCEEEVEEALRPYALALDAEDWDEETIGPALWWKFPIDEPPYVGGPNDSDWPGYHTHFTMIPEVDGRALPKREWKLSWRPERVDEHR